MFLRFQAIIGGSIAAVSFLALFIMQQYPRPMVFGMVLTGWILLLLASFWIIHSMSAWKGQVLPVLIALTLAMTAVFVVVEHSLIRYMVALVGSGAMGVMYGWALQRPHHDGSMYKPFRRLLMILWVFSAYGLSAFLFAVQSFFPIPSFFLILPVLQGILMAVIAVMIWRLYFDVPLKGFGVWGLLMSIMFFELAWALYMLPLVYTVTAALYIWMWYIMMLMIRFHFSARGIDWKQQKLFLITNGLLYIIFLFFIVRWV